MRALAPCLRAVSAGPGPGRPHTPGGLGKASPPQGPRHTRDLNQASLADTLWREVWATLSYPRPQDLIPTQGHSHTRRDGQWRL